MEHDIIYKPPRLEGFGGEAMKAIEARMRSVMRKHLIPAGYEFQKIAYDFDRLSRGLELFDGGALEAMRVSENTNQLFEAVERFVDYILPNYDDVPGVYADVWPALVAAARKARNLPIREIETSWGNLPGNSSEQVESKIADAIKDLRYLDIDKSFEDSAALFDEAADDETREIWLGVIDSVAKNNFSVWEKYGAYVQNHLMKHITQRKMDARPAAWPIALTVLKRALDTSVDSSTRNYDTFTFKQRSIAPSDLLRECRSLAIDYLIDQLPRSEDDQQRREVLNTIEIAAHLPYAKCSDVLLEIILDNSIRVVTFFENVVFDLSYELRSDMEHEVLLLHHRFRVRPEGFPVALNPKADAILAAALSFREKVNADPEFIMFKTLVGFRSVFPDAWTGDPFDFERDQIHQAARLAEYVQDVSAATLDVWLARMQRFVLVESNDPATYAAFGRFVQELARQKPLVVLAFLPTLEGPLARFVPGFLHGLSESPEAACVEPLLWKWVKRRAFISEALHFLRHAGQVDNTLLVHATGVALEENNLPALLSAANAGVIHATGANKDRVLRDVAMPAIKRLSAEGAFRWIDDLASLNHQGKLAAALNEDAREELVGYLAAVPEVNHHVEELLVILAEGDVKTTLVFFDRRLRDEDRKDRPEFEPVPFNLRRLPNKLRLGEAADIVTQQAYAWWEADRSLFLYRGGRLVANLYSDPSVGLSAALVRFVENEQADRLDFVLRILRSYSGQDFLLPIAREILKAHALSEQQNGELEAAFTATGVVSGDFGFVEAYRQKRNAIEAWRTDSSPRIRAFAERYQRSLDRMIASEKRRSEQDMELRKRNYGEVELEE